jgi:hypothetical protein
MTSEEDENGGAILDTFISAESLDTVDDILSHGFLVS